jgi:hypothetical protein
MKLSEIEKTKSFPFKARRSLGDQVLFEGKIKDIYLYFEGDNILPSSIMNIFDDWDLVEESKKKVKMWKWIFSNGVELGPIFFETGAFYSEERAKMLYGKHLVARLGYTEREFEV